MTYDGSENGELEGRPLNDELGGATNDVGLAEEEEGGGSALLSRAPASRRHPSRDRRSLARPETRVRSYTKAGSIKARLYGDLH